jgi:hypothetical protein
MIMDVSKRFCPVCKAENEIEAIVCVNCGARLDDPSRDSEHKTKTADMQALTPEMIREWLLEAEEEAVAPDIGIAFYVKGLSKPAWIDSRKNLSWAARSGRLPRSCLILLLLAGTAWEYPGGM